MDPTVFSAEEGWRMPGLQSQHGSRPGPDTSMPLAFAEDVSEPWAQRREAGAKGQLLL